MHLVRFLAEIAQIVDESSVEWHDWFQVDLPELFSNFEVQTHIFVSNQVELVELHIHAVV